MKAICPTSSSHKEFVTVAYVSEDWVVDEHGNFLSVHEGDAQEILHKPNSDNIWTCLTCGAKAKVEE